MLTAGGATLDPDGSNIKLVAGGWLKKLARGNAGADAVKVDGLKAIVALAPGGGLPRSAWGDEGLAAITAPLLLIQGDSDPVVDYTTGALAVFGGAVNADRYLLTYKQAGHSIALNPAPPEMRGSCGISTGSKTRFGGRTGSMRSTCTLYHCVSGSALAGDVDKRAYLDVPVVDSDAGEWKACGRDAMGSLQPRRRWRDFVEGLPATACKGHDAYGIESRRIRAPRSERCFLPKMDQRLAEAERNIGIAGVFAHHMQPYIDMLDNM